MRLIKSNIWNFQRVLLALAATQEVPGHIRLHSRGSTKDPPTSRGAQFPTPSSRGGIILPAWSGKNSRSSRRISRGGALHRKGESNSRVVPPFPESPRCLSPFQGNLFFLHCLDVQPEDRLTPRWYLGQPCGKASWESLVGKPRGKASRESHRSLDPSEGKRDTDATAREESARAGPHSRRGLTPLGRLRSTPRSMSALERNPQVPALTPHKVLGPSIDGRGIPRGPRATRMGTGLS